jgi:hypothetical protein
MSDPSMKVLAQSAKASYDENSTPLASLRDYERQNHLSSPDISVFNHKVEPHHIISHRGTDLHSDTVGKQLKADANILFGNTSHDKIHRDRAKETEKVMKSIKETHPDSKIHLTGHSLGGSTSQHAMIKSKYVRDNVTSHNTFNAGTSPLQTTEIDKNSPKYKEIASKSTHHHIIGDEISRNIQSNMIGKIKKYKNNNKPSIGQHILKFAEKKLKKSKLGSLVHFGADKLLNTLSSHSLNNFTNG